ncbi:MAG: translocation/assembly module TamB domain-containing protein, partial [Thermodesulfobacteriota bacterium]
GQNVAFKNTEGEVQGIEVAGQGIVNNFRRPEFNFSAYFNSLKPGDWGEFNIYTKSEGRLVSKDNLDAAVDLSVINSDVKGKRVWTNLQPIKIKGTNASIEGNINTEFGRTYVNGNYDFIRFLTGNGKNSFDFRANINDLDTSELFEILDFNPEKFEIGKNSVLESDLILKGYWIDKLDHNFNISYNALNIKDDKLGNLDLKGISNIFPDKIDLDISTDFENLNIKSVLSKYEFNNRVNGNIKLKGGLPIKSSFLQKSNLEIQSDLNTSNAYGINNISSVYVGTIKEGKVNIDKLDINSDEFVFSAKKRVGRSGSLNLDFNFNSKDLGFLAAIDKRLLLSGAIISNGTIKGELLQPDLEIKADINNFEYGSSYSAKSLVFDLSTNTDLNNLKLNLSSKLSEANIFDKYFDNADFTAKTNAGDIISNVRVSNSKNEYIKSDFLIRGISKKNKIIELSSLELFLNENRLKNRDLITLSFSPDKKEFKNFNLSYGDGFLESNGVLNKNGTINFSALFTNLDQNLISSLFKFEKTLGGKLSGDLKIEGTLIKPEFNLNMVTKDITYDEFQSKGLNINIFGKDKKINADIKSINQEVDEIKLTGKINTDLNLNNFGKNIQNADLDLILSANNFDLSFLRPLNSSIKKLNGTFSSNIKINGKLSDPILKGDLNIEKTELGISQLLNELVIETANIKFENDVLRLTDAKVSAHNGSAQLTGIFNLKNLIYKGEAQLDELFLHIPTIKADLSGKVSLQGEKEKIDINGRLRVANKKITFEPQENKKVKDIKFIDDKNDNLIIVTDHGPDYFTKNFKIDMIIEIPRGTEVKTKDSEVDVVGEIIILKNYDSQNIFRGNIDTLGGHYIVFGKLFNIDGGSLNFPGSTEANPQIEITASYDISDIEVYINVAGTAKNPLISFSSNPPLEKDDIISYLVYGTSRENRGDQQGAVGSNFAANFAAGEISKLIGSNLGLDVLNFQGGDSGGFSDPQIKVGSFVTDDIFISYE